MGYVGHRPALDGLRRLEYRGYDSAGVAVLTGSGEQPVERKAGRLANLEARLDEVGWAAFAGTAGMGHTRWATHGAPLADSKAVLSSAGMSGIRWRLRGR